MTDPISPEEKHQTVLNRLKIDGLEAWFWVNDPEATTALRWRFPRLRSLSRPGDYAIFGPEDSPDEYCLLTLFNASTLRGREITPGWQR